MEKIKNTKLRTTEYQRMVEANDEEAKVIQDRQSMQAEELAKYDNEKQELAKNLDETRRKYYFAKEFYRVEKE